MRAAASTVLSFRPIDELEATLLDSWHEVSTATHRFLVLLREFDLRHGWRAYGNADCAEWLDWKCGISRVTAQEKVRVAKALWSLPLIDAAFERGDLSYSKVRAVSRVATDRNEADLLTIALTSTAAHLESYCQRLRNGEATISTDDARRLHERPSLTRTFRDDGIGTLHVEMPRAELELVLNALEFVGRTLPEDPTRSLFAKGADALLQMARDALAGRAGDGSAGENYQVMVHVDADALSGNGGESDLPLPTVKRLCCDGAVTKIVHDDAGCPLDVGRKQRIVSGALKKAVVARDRACTFPGCHHTRYLDAHHVRHWADGGETNLENLLLLCTAHHTLVHEGGFSIRRHRDGRWYFVRPDGRPVEIVPSSAEDGADTDVVSSSAEDVREGRAVYRLTTPLDAVGSEVSNRASRSAPIRTNARSVYSSPSS